MTGSREIDEKKKIFKDVCSRAGIHLSQPPEYHQFAFEESRFRGNMHLRNGQAGFYAQKSHQISPIADCKVLPKGMSGAYESICNFASKFPTFNGEIYFAVSPDQKQITLDFLFDSHISSVARTFLAETLQTVPVIKGVVITNGKKKNTLFGNPRLPITWNRHHVQLNPTSFFQSNPNSWQTFWSIVSEWSAKFLSPNQWVWDMHAGSGFLASAVSDHPVFATEPNSIAHSNLKSLARKKGRVLQSSAENVLEKLTEINLGGLILDPPRIGLSRKIRDWIVRQGPESVLFFSCEWGTLTRDLKALLKSYEIEGPLHLLDVSPGTFRMESVVMLRRSVPRQNKMSS